MGNFVDYLCVVAIISMLVLVTILMVRIPLVTMDRILDIILQKLYQIFEKFR